MLEPAIPDSPRSPRPDVAMAEPVPIGVSTGPGAAFDEFCRSGWRAAVTLGWSLTGSWSTAEDVVQDVFFDAYRRWEKVSQVNSRQAWIRRAVSNRSASVRRRHATERRGEGRLRVVSARDADAHHDDRTGMRAVDRVGDPVFWDAVRTLPEQQRTVVVLHYLEDRSIADIADLLGLRTGTVKAHLHRGRKTLARRLSPSSPTNPTTTDTKTTDPTTTNTTTDTKTTDTKHDAQGMNS